MDPTFPVTRIAQQLPAQLSELSGPAQEMQSQALGQKFQALMNGGATPAAPQHTENSGPSQIGAVIEQQDVQFATAVNDTRALAEAAPSMSAAQLTAAEMQVMGELTTANVEIQVKTGIVQSSQGAVETLMKNQ